jgi:serine/threonine-protein kinase HipA
MPARTPQEIFVYAHDYRQSEPLLMGVLQVSEVRGKEVFSFEYDSAYLNSDWAFEIDPQLKLYKGPQYLSGEQSNFGIFLDSSPDRWGRVLMERREAVKARAQGRSLDRLMESDYLLGVYDESRMGALRFKTEQDGPFLDDDHRHATPPITSLRELEHASFDLENEHEDESETYLQNLALLVAPGSSLGGARPKANVKDTDDSLWIAKFPSRKDDIDQGAWEYVVYQLAIECGIEMSLSKASTYYSNRHTFLTKRFDRDAEGNRIHFFSAMTLLGYQDGVDANAGVSYLELAELLIRRGAEPEDDLKQLWMRIVFNILVSNTDDHLRNHGFILTRKGVRLSPAFDINPDPKGVGLNLNIDEQSNSLDLELTREVAPYFRLDETEANHIIKQMQKVVSDWRSLAESMSISRREVEKMSAAFTLGR